MAYEELVRRYQDVAVRTAHLFAPDGDAEDAVQEAFVKAHARARSVPGRRSVPAVAAADRRQRGAQPAPLGRPAGGPRPPRRRGSPAGRCGPIARVGGPRRRAPDLARSRRSTASRDERPRGDRRPLLPRPLRGRDRRGPRPAARHREVAPVARARTVAGAARRSGRGGAAWLTGVVSRPSPTRVLPMPSELLDVGSGRPRSPAPAGSPDLASRARSRIEAEGITPDSGWLDRLGLRPTGRPATRPLRRGLVLALAALLVLAAIAGAIGFGLPGLRIVFGPTATVPSPSPSPDDQRLPCPDPVGCPDADAHGRPARIRAGSRPDGQPGRRPDRGRLPDPPADRLALRRAGCRLDRRRRPGDADLARPTGRARRSPSRASP